MKNLRKLARVADAAQEVINEWGKTIDLNAMKNPEDSLFGTKKITSTQVIMYENTMLELIKAVDALEIAGGQE